MTYAASSVVHWDGDDDMQIQEDGAFVEQSFDTTKRRGSGQARLLGYM